MTTNLVISGGKLAEPSAPFSMFAGEFLNEQFGLGRSASPALHLELGWIDEQGNAAGDHPIHELLGMEFDPAFVRPLKLFDQLGLRAIELGLRRVELKFRVIRSTTLPTTEPQKGSRKRY